MALFMVRIFLWIITLVMFFSYLQYSSQQSNNIQPATAVIILGSGIEKGRPSPTLKQRLDVGAAYAKRYPETLLVVTGGLGFQNRFLKQQ